MAYVAYHFHWTRDELLDLSHRERHRWVQEISKINKKINRSSGQSAGASGGGMGGFSGGLNLQNPDW